MAALADDGDSSFVDAAEPPESLWKSIKENVPKSELPEIRRLLGDSLVDLNVEMHSEAEAWLGIWRDARSQHDRQPKAQAPRSVLADPPAVREMLKQEISLLLLNIQEKASEQGRDGNKALLRYSPDVVSYVLGTSTSSHELQRPRSARSHDGGQQLPSRLQSANSSEEVRSFSRLSSTPSYLDDIEAIKDKLNIIHIDEVVAHLQLFHNSWGLLKCDPLVSGPGSDCAASVLKEECEALERHVQFLQGCVEQDRSDATVREPSVAELKEERKLIERDLQLALPTHCSLKSDKVPICGTMLKSCRDITLLRGSSANILKPRLLSALAPVQNVPEDTTKTLCNPLLSVKNVTPQSTLHDTKLSTAATERSCHRSDVPLRKCNWNPDNPYCNNNSRSPLELPEVSVPSLDSIHFVDAELSRLGCHIKPGFSQCNTVARNSRSKTHFHLVPMQRSASSPGFESASSARASGPESPTQMLSSKFRLVPNCGPPSKIAVQTLIPTPPSVEKPAGRVQSASRRIRLLQGDHLASST